MSTRTSVTAAVVGAALAVFGATGASAQSLTIPVEGAPAAEALGWRLGCQAYSFNRFTFYEAVANVKALGLNVIEAYPGQALSKDMPDAKFDHTMPPELREKVLAHVKSMGITIVNYGVVGLGDTEADQRKVFEFAKAMGIETIVSEPPMEQLPAIDKLAQEYGINVALHNHPTPSKYWNPDTVLEAVRGLSNRVGACADTGHWMRSGVDPIEAVKKLEGRIISFHFKDLNAFGTKGEAAHDVPWGTGLVNARAVLAELQRQGFKGVFSVEYEYKWENSLPDIAHSVLNFNTIAANLAESAKP